MSAREILELLVGIRASVDEAVAGLDRVGAKVGDTEARFNSLGGAASVAGGIIVAEFSRNVVRAVESAYTESADSFQSFESALAGIQAASLTTVDDIEKFMVSVKETTMALGVEFGVGAAAAANALESLVKAGLKGEAATKALSGALALAKIEGIDTASGYAAGLANVGATAANMGLSLDETAAALVILDNTFGSAQESGTFLNRMLRDLTAKAEDAGIELYNMDGSMKSLDEIVGILREKIKGFGDNQKAVNEFLGQFDTRAQKAILGLVEYDKSVADVQTSLEDQASAQDMVNIVLETASGKLSVARAEMENTNIESGKLTSGINVMWTEFAASLGPIGSVAESLGPAMLQGAMQGLTVKAIPALIGKLTGAGGLTGSFGSVGSMLMKFGPMIGMSGPVGLGILALGAGVAVFAAAWSQNWWGIRDKTKAVIDKLGGLFEDLRSLLGGLKTWWDEIWGGLGSKADEAASDVVAATDAMMFGRSPGGIYPLIGAIGELAETAEGQLPRVSAAFAEAAREAELHTKAIEAAMARALEIERARQAQIDVLQQQMLGSPLTRFEERQKPVGERESFEKGELGGGLKKGADEAFMTVSERRASARRWAERYAAMGLEEAQRRLAQAERFVQRRRAQGNLSGAQSWQWRVDYLRELIGAGGVTAMQHGFEGWVTGPTLFLAGEAGPEHVAVTPKRSYGAIDVTAPGRGAVIGTLEVNIGVTGALDKKTADYAIKEMLRRLRSIGLEDTITGGSTKMIRDFSRLVT